jgi:hypothetical protein
MEMSQEHDLLLLSSVPCFQRARMSRMLTQAHGIVIQCHNIPFGDTQDIEDEIFPFIFGCVETAIEVLTARL